MADKSLDEVIAERNLNSSGKRGRGRGGFKRGRGRGSRVITPIQNIQWNVGSRNTNKGGARGSNLSSSLKSRLGVPRAGGAGDQKQASSFVDARDRLNLIARRTDAREKLNKIARQTDARTKLTAKRKQSNPNVISFRGGDDRPQAAKKSSLTRTIQNSQRLTRRDEPEPRFTGQFTVTNTQTQRRPLQFTVQNEPTLTTIRNPAARSFQSTTISLSSNKRSLSSTSREEENFGSFRSASRIRPPTFDSSPPKIPKISPPISNIGSLLNPKPKPISSLDGARVIVSNLQHTVTEEDIKELFGAIGILKRARLVKQGLAEVVYTKKESAVEAINTYHSRELDGKPMHCKLDTGGETGFKKNTISDKFKKMRSENNPTLPFKTNTSDKVIELDKQVIQKVLFKTLPASSHPSKAVVFTVKI